MMTPRAPSSTGSWRAIAAAARRSTLNTPVRYTSIVVLKPSRSSGEPSLPIRRPPLAGPPCASTEIRSGPSDSASATAPFTSSVFVASVRTWGVSSSSASALPFSSARSAITTLAPAACSRRTVASPRPPAPPTTMAELPLICIAVSLLATRTLELREYYSRIVTGASGSMFCRIGESREQRSSGHHRRRRYGGFGAPPQRSGSDHPAGRHQCRRRERRGGCPHRRRPSGADPRGRRHLAQFGGRSGRDGPGGGPSHGGGAHRGPVAATGIR